MDHPATDSAGFGRVHAWQPVQNKGYKRPALPDWAPVSVRLLFKEQIRMVSHL